MNKSGEYTVEYLLYEDDGDDGCGNGTMRLYHFRRPTLAEAVELMDTHKGRHGIVRCVDNVPDLNEVDEVEIEAARRWNNKPTDEDEQYCVICDGSEYTYPTNDLGDAIRRLDSSGKYTGIVVNFRKSDERNLTREELNAARTEHASPLAVLSGNTIIAGRYVVCAANRMTVLAGPKNAQGTHVIAGARHHDGVMNPLIKALVGGDSTRILKMEQGFIDQHGVFMDRVEACTVAAEAGQLNVRRRKTAPSHILFSEDLY